MNYRNIVISAMQAAALYLASLIIPVLGLMAALFSPVPSIIAYVRGGRQEGLASIGLACMLISIVAGLQGANRGDDSPKVKAEALPRRADFRPEQFRQVQRVGTKRCRRR